MRSSAHWRRGGSGSVSVVLGDVSGLVVELLVLDAEAERVERVRAWVNHVVTMFCCAMLCTMDRGQA